jgi:hypothetical protein
MQSERVAMISLLRDSDVKRYRATMARCLEDYDRCIALRNQAIADSWKFKSPTLTGMAKSFDDLATAAMQTWAIYYKWLYVG